MIGSTKFQFKLTISILWTKFSQIKVFLVENGKSEHHRWILHIRTDLGSKFQFRLTNVIFRAKFLQKGCFRSKTENLNFWVCPWSFLTILIFLAREPTYTTVFLNKARQRHLRHLLMRIKGHRVRKARKARMACINNG